MSDYDQLVQGGAAIQIDDYDLGYLKDGVSLAVASEMNYHVVEGVHSHVGARNPQQNYEIITTLSEITLGNLGRAWDFQAGADNTTAVFTDLFADADNWEAGVNGTWSIDTAQMKCISEVGETCDRMLKTTVTKIPDYGVFAVQIDVKISDKTKCSAGVVIKGLSCIWNLTEAEYQMSGTTCDTQVALVNATDYTWRFEHLANGDIRWYIDGVLLHTKAASVPADEFYLRVGSDSDGTEYAHWDDFTIYTAAEFGGSNAKPTEPKVEIFAYVPGASLHTRTIQFDRAVAVPGGEVKTSDAAETAITMTYHGLYDSSNTRVGVISDAQS